MENLFLDPFFILLIAGFIGFFMAFGIGANDVANSMGTSVGSKAITIKQAIIIAAIFEFLGAFLAGGEVTSTIRKGIVDPDIYANDINIFVIGMMAALLAGGTWLYIASLRGWPVSTTHSIVGSIIGFVLITKGVDAVSWSKVGNIAMSWVTSPVFSATLAFALYMSAKKLILDRAEPEKAAITYIPFYSFLVAVVISLVTARKGLKHVGIQWSDNEMYLFIFIFSSIVGLITAFFLRTNKEKIMRDGGIEFAFGLLMIVSASAMAFAHGSNDVANAIGPLAAIVSVVDTGEIGSKAAINPWVLFVGAIGIVFGLATLGSRVIKTVGQKITTLTPSLGFSAEMATASTVVAATYLGFPISTTHTLVGGVIGVGLAKGAEHLDFSSIRRIIASWLVTIPAGAAFTVLFYLVLRIIFNV
ncbi:inorganic phosphate transporter [Gammaproteobacteria bacterium]|jgi:PiT family inorganic phosphate transporter|nr:inorganic phosphate transporter [bacterium]MDA9340596.1 inorganic phosphate transporter [Gammaproteobacteria bacterium]MDA9370616.1 inorganic phosphate transporter [Gammaproteobacteria bacterium]MDB9896061.1 inorganic phosphate transporter [Gammaproteobacteria bacterium]MDC1300176.1 inorganic phosphate transporter [Gammaproteobacteria bacterium]